MLGDLEHKRKVRPDRQHKFTQENGLGSHVVSARTGEMVSHQKNGLLWWEDLWFSKIIPSVM
jgi:hypothetical protein